jgi:RNA polymerase sigma-70 factor (ECF subfamily)
MSRLSNGDRELLRLIAWEGLTPIQIAVLDDVPASTIRSRLRRARARLAAALAAERDGPNRAAPPPAAPTTRSASVAFTDPEDFR